MIPSKKTLIIVAAFFFLVFLILMYFTLKGKRVLSFDETSVFLVGVGSGVAGLIVTIFIQKKEESAEIWS